MAISEELRIEITAQANRAVGELKKAEKATGGLGKTVKALGVAAAAAFAVRQVSKFAKESVAAYKVQQTAVNNLNSALSATGQYTKENSRDLQDYASELQSLTVVGDEATLAALQLGINMGLTSEQAKEATKGAIGMSRAYGVDLNTAMRAVTASVQGNHSMLSRYMPQIRDAKDEAEKMAMVQESLASAFAVAEGETLTLAGAQQQMKNALGDMGEIVGSILAPAMMTMAQATKGYVESIQSFLQEDANIDKIAEAVSFVSGTFSTLWEVAKQVFNNIIEAIKVVFTPIADLVSGVGEASFVFDILAGIMEVVGAVSRVVATAIKEQVETIIQFGKASVASFNVIRAGVDRLKGDMSKEEFRSIASDAGDAWKGVGEEMLESFTEPFTVAVDEGRSFLGNVRDQADEYQSIWTDAKNGAYAAVSGSLSGTNNPPPGPTGGGGGEDEAPLGEIQLSAAEAYYNNIVSMKQSAAEREADIDRAFQDFKDEQHQKTLEDIKEEVAAREAATSYIVGLAGSMFDNLAAMYDADTEAGKKAARAAAIVNKGVAIFNAYIATQEAAAKALTAGPIAGPILSGIITGMGLANMALIAAKPIPMAEGGIVMPSPGGTIAQIGEAGRPEAVIPLDRAGGFGTTYHIHVNAVAGGQEEVAAWVQEGLERARRTGRIAA